MIQDKSKIIGRSDGERPVTLTQTRSAFPAVCGPGCSCGTPVKTNKRKIVIMLVVVLATAIALIYKEMM